ncbi:MAG: hypothetical protein IK039_01480 [Bacteroidaceae bacterium]|nr:hypothetical protein [Bacteroidaceae bacterium]
MKTRNKLILGVSSLAFLFVGCVENELPKFTAEDSFIAFSTTDVSLAENSKKPVAIEVLCSSLYGINASVEFEITPREVQVDSTVVKVGDKDSVVVTYTDKGAKEGVHFTYTTNCLANYSTTDSTKLYFSKNQVADTIFIQAIDNGIFTGDLFFSIKLKNVEGANLGASTLCEVTVADDEHPLAFMLGSFSGKGESYFNGATTWDLSITKDPDGDLHKVWLYPFVPDGTAKSIYGIVSDDKASMKIPVKQLLATLSDGRKAYLNGFRDLYEDDDVIPEGEFLNVTIAPDATMTIADAFGSNIYSTDGTATNSWYNIMLNGAVLTKK